MANANMMHPGSVASPMTVVSTPSYSYGYPGYPYMRGGSESGRWYRDMVERVRLWRSYGKVEKQPAAQSSTPIRVLREMRAQRELREHPA